MATRLGLYGNREMGGRALASARLSRGEPEKEALACCWYGKGHSERQVEKHPIQHLINRSASHQTPTISFNLLHNKQHNSFSCREKTPLFIRQVWDQLKLWKRQRKNKANSFHMDRYYTGTVKRSFHKHTHTHTFTPSALRSGSPEAFQFSQVYVILSWKTFFLYVHETNILFIEIKAMYIQTQKKEEHKCPSTPLTECKNTS